MKRAIVWFRQDLRLSDNTALSRACSECDEVFPVFIDDSVELTISQSTSSLGRAGRVWLHHSIESLKTSLESLDSRLTLRQGNSLKELLKLIEDTRATHLYWNRCYEPEVRKRDEKIKSLCRESVKVLSVKGNLLVEPWEILKQNGTPYRIFTPYWKILIKQLVVTKPITIPGNLKAPKNWPVTLTTNDLNFLPKAPISRWDIEMMERWQVGESSALKRFLDFLQDDVKDYEHNRDFPAIKGTSLLSTHLHFGEISPLQLFYYGKYHQAQNPGKDIGIEHILRQVAWREFAHYLLYHFPQTVTEPLNEKFVAFQWSDNTAHLKHWQRGTTGFPIIDAGMRQLYATGYMHNRVRMIVSSFLCKNLLIHWRRGEAWFRDTLVDADLANNTFGWQWVAGCGADAAPYFRIFNPILQSTKFDKEGDYIRRWVPEIRKLNNKHIHQPTSEQAQQTGYPEMMVDLKTTRKRALDHYKNIK